MKSDYKPLYISVAINFLIGAVLGIILFYGQVKSSGDEIGEILEYNSNVTLSDFFRLSWINVLWMISMLFAHAIMPIVLFHPVAAIRGTVSTFSALYILSVFGIKKMAVSLFPQCVSILPLLFYFSADVSVKQRENVRSGNEPFFLNRREVARILLLSILAAAVEVLFFALFCNYLF